MAKLISTADLLQSSLDFKELDLKQYRQLLKCFLGDEVYADLIFNNTDNIIKELTSLSYKEITNLNFWWCLSGYRYRTRNAWRLRNRRD